MSRIIIDTREQKPLWRTSKKTITTKLDVGDYTREDLLGIAHAERKSPSDLYSTITGGHVRFRNEILLAKKLGINMTVFIECTAEHFYAKKWDFTKKAKIRPDVLAKIIATIKQKYGLDFVWCNDREHMRFRIKQWLNYNKSLEKTELQ